MYILGVDTSTKYFSIAVSDTEKILGEIYFDIGLKHSELLYKYIDILLKETKIELENITKIGCSIGPGSFTGIRIGLSACRTISQLLNIPIVGISTLDILAGGIWKYFYSQNCSVKKIVCPIIKSNSDEIYTAIYELKKGYRRLSDYMLLGIDDLIEKIFTEYLGQNNYDEIIFVGDIEYYYQKIANSKIKNLFILDTSVFNLLHASVLVKLAVDIKGEKYSKVKPLYIMPPRIRPLKMLE